MPVDILSSSKVVRAVECSSLAGILILLLLFLYTVGAVDEWIRRFTIERIKSVG